MNLHERINDLDKDTYDSLMLSTIKILGRFSLSEAHHWVSNCLPDFPPNVSQDEEDQVHKFQFKSTFVGTYLFLELSKQQIIIKSDNLSVMTIIKVSKHSEF